MLHTLCIDCRAGRREVDCPMTVVLDHNRNPVALVLEHQPGVTEVLTYKDGPVFYDRLKLLDLPAPDVTQLQAPQLPSNFRPLLDS